MADRGSDRPIGWWLKEADRRLDQAFDEALEGTGCDRRSWQVLASLARQPATPARLAELLAPFEPSGAVEDLAAGLRRRGLIEEASGVLSLTGEGATAHASLSGPVADVRRRVAAALPDGDYATLVRLLGQLTDALPRPTDAA
jgi:hypothetical protein